ncbi:MAG TPA: sigma-70 family RNA polymerase sigma factor [Roseovarius sp.]|nr:sigma-70 family RNA polymerase sigma factor [Roseovarius sp.]
MATRDDIERYILRAAQGDRAAFKSLYDATSAKLLGVALRVLNDRAEAEDVLQDIYVKVWHNAARYNVNGLSPMTWLITIARNSAVDRLRKRHRSGTTEALDERIADGGAGPEAQAAAASERRRLDACMAELTVDRAEAVRRAYLDGETYADLAARFEVPLNTMRTWLRRSLLKLRECLSR